MFFVSSVASVFSFLATGFHSVVDLVFACTPLKSNLGISEELERLSSYQAKPEALFCRNTVCANRIDQVPADAVSSYTLFGKTAIGNPLWRCRICYATLFKNIKPIASSYEE